MRRRINFYSIVVSCFFLLSFFPYVTPIKLGTDIQPYSMLLAFVIVAFGVPLSWKSISIIMFGAFSAFLLIVSDLEFSDFRSCLSVISFCVTYLAFSAVFEKQKYRGEFIEKWCWSAILIYGIAACIQYIVDPTIFSFLSPRYSSNSGEQGRGVESLTAEPTFYGFVVLFLCLIYVHEKGKFNAPVFCFWGVGLLEILFLAKSSSALLSFSVILPSYLFIYLNIKNIYKYMLVIGAIPAFIFLIGVLPLLLGEESRISLLAGKVSDPFRLIETDLSVSDRIFNIYYAYKGAVENYFFPHGFGNWYSYLLEASSANTLVSNITGEDERILSLFGGVLYEFGFLSIPFFIVFFSGVALTVTRAGCSWPAYIFIGFSYFILFSQAIPLSHPLFSMFLALLSCEHRNAIKGS